MKTPGSNGSAFLTLLLTVALAGVAAAGFFMQATQAPGPLVAEKLVYIAPGKSVRGIAARLQDENVIASSLVFRVEAKTKALKAGEYRFLPGMSTRAVVALLQSGKTWQRKITIPEGLTVVEIIGLLTNEPVLTGDVTTPPEGSLLPETYHFSHGDQRQAIIERMQKSMRDALQAEWEKRSAALPVKTPAEAVILASVVEKETGLAAERPRIAGVFANRLRQGIPLQSDPTVIYAITQGKEKFSRSLTYKDLKNPSPYNTYVVPGLPPGPIANPGRASLAAVLNPEKTDYIYFVADGTGGHAFAKTLQEHNNNVARWRKLAK